MLVMKFLALNKPIRFPNIQIDRYIEHRCYGKTGCGIIGIFGLDLMIRLPFVNSKQILGLVICQSDGSISIVMSFLSPILFLDS